MPRPSDVINALYGLRDHYRAWLDDPDPKVQTEAQEALHKVRCDIRNWYAKHGSHSS